MPPKPSWTAIRFRIPAVINLPCPSALPRSRGGVVFWILPDSFRRVLGHPRASFFPVIALKP